MAMRTFCVHLVKKCKCYHWQQWYLSRSDVSAVCNGLPTTLCYYRDMSQLEQNEIIRDVFRTLCYSEHGHTRCFIKMPGALMLDQVPCSLLQLLFVTLDSM
jgi:hypothetical protein